MKTNRLSLFARGLALTGAALVLAPPGARAGEPPAPAPIHPPIIPRTPPSPTLEVTISAPVGLLVKHEVVSFSGSDYCDASINLSGGADVACGHSVFVGIWEPSVTTGGDWVASVTLESTAGGDPVALSSVGLISGSFDVGCGSGNGFLYAYDIDQGTMVFGASIPSFACVL